MIASVMAAGADSWKMTLNDRATNKMVSMVKTVKDYKGHTAEIIYEATLPQAVTANYVFDLASVTTAAGNRAFFTLPSTATLHGKIDSGTPSLPDTDNDGFQLAFGQKQPCQPGATGCFPAT